MTVHDWETSTCQRTAGLMPAGRAHRRDQPGGSLPRRLRRGFTLLEMLLATFVSVLLLGALYVAMDLQIRHTQTGRDVIEQSTLAHSLLARMTGDIKKCVIQVGPNPLPPLSSSTPGSSSAGGSTSSPSTAASGSSPTASAPAPSSSNSPDSSSSSGSSAGASASTSSTTSDTIQFQLGVQGTANTLSLYISRLPSELNKSRAEPLSDLRLISYWLAGGTGTPLGLARREFKQVTSDEANNQSAAENPLNEAVWVFAPEVKSLRFRYFDGTEWSDTWDSTKTGSDYVTPVGPPLLIEITLGIIVPSGDNRYGGQPSLKVYRHVVSLPMADGVVR